MPLKFSLIKFEGQKNRTINELTELVLIRELNPEPIIDVPLRRSDRVPHQSDRYYNFLIQNGYPVELDENNEDPITYMDATQMADSEEWLKAMRSEMESMKINDVWILFDLLEGVKPIGCKWIFKRKGSKNGKVEIYKARLVVKCYCQHYGIDYGEIFLLW